MDKVVTFSLCCFLLSRTGTFSVSTQATCVTCNSSYLEIATDQVLLHLAKRRVLDRLGLKDRPNITNPIPRAMLTTLLRKLHVGKVVQDGSVEIANSLDSSAEDQSYEIISFPESDSTSSPRTRLNFLIWDKEDTPTFIQQANLWLYFKVFRSTLERNKPKMTVKIFARDQGDLGHTLISVKKFNSTRSGWHTFLVTDAIQSLVNRGDKGLTFDLEVEDCGTGGGTPCFGHFRDESHQPFLKVKTVVTGSSHRIQKRGIECSRNTRLCCRKRFYMDFRSIGWDDWIIAPRGYYSNYCMGSCPPQMAGAPGITSSFHTAVFNLYRINSMEPVMAMKSCCIPTQFSRASILYFDGQQSMVKRDIPDMVVEECGCT
ncbi:inhibin beta B chain-like [Heterodontus francisci]|uniref:inhibin beta B chain-like n=1 Tax=Heterodontus francisci TaxID=7792 RepID=UPI00355BA6C0